MRYLKLFENFDSIDKQTRDIIESVFNECFYDYMMDYGAKVLFQYGVWSEDFNFFNDKFWSDIRNTHPGYENGITTVKTCQATILNHSWGEGQRLGKLEIYTDENSNNLFKESVENLKRYLDEKIECQVEAPEELISTWYSITIMIKLPN